MTTVPDESEALWHKDQGKHGWVLPPAAPLALRLPIVRHIRCAWHTYRAERTAYAFSSIGIGIGGINQYDRWVLYAIARGWC